MKFGPRSSRSPVAQLMRSWAVTHILILGKTVLITGGSRGLGLILARQFGREGARVVICARDEQELDRARIDLQNRRAEVLALRCDITSSSEVSEMVTGIQDRLGNIDVLVNNAGVIQVGPLLRNQDGIARSESPLRACIVPCFEEIQTGFVVPFTISKVPQAK
jgi:NAD(P)-dependent dehydrogenase (short-subunit alcohol dehydrogenase family)